MLYHDTQQQVWEGRSTIHSKNGTMRYLCHKSVHRQVEGWRHGRPNNMLQTVIDGQLDDGIVMIGKKRI